MLTELGKFLRDLRIQNGQLLIHMSKILNTTPSFLSGVETGKNKMPLEWIKILARQYNMDAQKRKYLIKLVISGETTNKQ